MKARFGKALKAKDLAKALRSGQNTKHTPNTIFFLDHVQQSAFCVDVKGRIVNGIIAFIKNNYEGMKEALWESLYPTFKVYIIGGIKCMSSYGIKEE
jgi:sulfur transfer protein SufE